MTTPQCLMHCCIHAIFQLCYKPLTELKDRHFPPSCQSARTDMQTIRLSKLGIKLALETNK